MVFDVGLFSTNQQPETADEMFLIFLSHKDEVKNEVQTLKENWSKALPLDLLEGLAAIWTVDIGTVP